MNGWPLGELGNTVFIIAFIISWLAFCIYGGSLPNGGEGWFASILLPAFFAAILGLFTGILTDSLYRSPSTGREPAPETTMEIYRDTR